MFQKLWTQNYIASIFNIRSRQPKPVFWIFQFLLIFINDLDQQPHFRLDISTRLKSFREQSVLELIRQNYEALVYLFRYSVEKFAVI